jgi:hypothetical protein
MPLLALLPGIVLFSSLFLMISWLLQLALVAAVWTIALHDELMNSTYIHIIRREFYINIPQQDTLPSYTSHTNLGETYWSVPFF